MLLYVVLEDTTYIVHEYDICRLVLFEQCGIPEWYVIALNILDYLLKQ